MAIDPKEQRRIMGKFATGVTVVTLRSGETLWGMTANAVTSLSLDPPLVIVAVDRKGQTHGYMKTAGGFAINILAAHQEELSRRFAAAGPKDFSDLTWTAAQTGAPILADTLGYVECRTVEILPGGDHDIFVGEILAGEARDGSPLLYFAGRYARIAE